MKIYKELRDMTDIKWSKIRHSSGTAGSFLKSYEQKNKIKHYYKLSNYNPVDGIIGHECINEVVVDRLLDRLNINHLNYNLIHANVNVRNIDYETYLCESIDFKSKGESKIALDVLYEMESAHGETVLDFCKRMNFEDFIYDMLVVDYLILNRDRHGANIEILKNPASKTRYPAPLFDHGLSLLFNYRSDKDILAFDVLSDRKVQCFVGGNSTYDNLLLIPKGRMLKLPKFDMELKEYLFEGLDTIVSTVWIEKVWEMLTKRASNYENLRNSR